MAASETEQGSDSSGDNPAVLYPSSAVLQNLWFTTPGHAWIA